MKITQQGLFLSIILWMGSCSDDTPNIVQEEKNIYKIEKQTFSLDKETNSEPYFLLGYGYDASKSLLHISDGIKGKVLDLTKITNIDQKTRIDRGAQSSGETSAENSKADVFQAMSLFPEYLALASGKSALLADFPNQAINYNEGRTTSKGYRLFYSASADETAFTEGFAYHIANSTPQEIVDLFGTHMIVGCSKGYWFKYLGYIDKETETPQLLTKEWKSVFYCSGGDTGKVTFDQSGTVELQAWQASYNEEENGEFVDFYQSYPIPLYEVLPEGDKKTALRVYIENYLK